MRFKKDILNILFKVTKPYLGLIFRTGGKNWGRISSQNYLEMWNGIRTCNVLKVRHLTNPWSKSCPNQVLSWSKFAVISCVDNVVCIFLIAIVITVIIIIIIIFEPNHSSPMLPKWSLVLRPVVPLHTVRVFMFHEVRPRLNKQTALLSFLSKTTWFVAAINYAPIIPYNGRWLG